MTTKLLSPDLEIESLAKPHNVEQPALRISIVIPLYNEEESIPALWEGLDEAIANYGQPAEVIIVDDGSKDRSFALLSEIAAKDPRFTIIRFRRNFGQTAGFAAGFAQARGEVVITMDADLQNDPMDIPKLMAKIDEGYDIVSGWRKDRQDRFIDRKLPSMMANRLISNVTDVRLHDYGCSLKAYRRDVLQHVHLYGELHRFIPALASPGRRHGDGGAGQPPCTPVWALQVRHQPHDPRHAGPDHGLVLGHLLDTPHPRVRHPRPGFCRHGHPDRVCT